MLVPTSILHLAILSHILWGSSQPLPSLYNFRLPFAEDNSSRHQKVQIYFLSFDAQSFLWLLLVEKPFIGNFKQCSMQQCFSHNDLQEHIKTLLSALASRKVQVSLCTPSARCDHPRLSKRQQNPLEWGFYRGFCHNSILLLQVTGETF